MTSSNHSPNDYDDLELRGLTALAAQMAYVRTLDDVLDRIDQLLNNYQPPKTGKIRIERWKRTKGAGSVLAPMAIRWIQNRTTLRWRGVVLPTYMLSRSGKSARDFHEHHDRVKRYLQIAQKVLQLRSAVFTRIERARLSMMLAEEGNHAPMLAILAALDAELAAAVTVPMRPDALVDAPLDDE